MFTVYCVSVTRKFHRECSTRKENHIMADKIIFYKNNPKDKVWWVDNGDDVKGEMVFSFDKKKL